MQTTANPQSSSSLVITWEPLPTDYPLPDDPVDNLTQPLLAAALREILELWGFITPAMIIATNFGLCATVNGKTVVKAPDWVYVPSAIPLAANQTRRSYTPQAEGDPPAVVMEFLSETDGGEYSMNPNYPYGKWWFYERILQVPIYAIFQPETGALDLYHLVSGHYEQQTANPDQRFWIEPLGLFLGVWQGTKADRTGYWLRWWDRQGNLLPWGTEQVEQERQRAEQEHQRAEQEHQRAEQERQRAEQERQRAEALAAQLRALGIEPQG
ncbi:MAG TPA: Uma2 family endonuclease [Leptolyngbyaceae cyanobacterium M65_K2018_010]|nr:Uma2 family endonuclease [Leptolyngbyaceae cyanobacterium M65_K2018_010]